MLRYTCCQSCMIDLKNYCEFTFKMYEQILLEFMDTNKPVAVWMRFAAYDAVKYLERNGFIVTVEPYNFSNSENEWEYVYVKPSFSAQINNKLVFCKSYKHDHTKEKVYGI